MKVKTFVELKINNGSDRDNVLSALVNAGYIVSVDKRKTPDSYLCDPVYDFYVIIHGGHQ